MGTSRQCTTATSPGEPERFGRCRVTRGTPQRRTERGRNRRRSRTRVDAPCIARVREQHHGDCLGCRRRRLELGRLERRSGFPLWAISGAASVRCCPDGPHSVTRSNTASTPASSEGTPSETSSFLAALAATSGDFALGVAECCAILQTVGSVLPPRTDIPVVLKATADGLEMQGQARIKMTEGVTSVSLIPEDAAGAACGDRSDRECGRDRHRSGIAFHERPCRVGARSDQCGVGSLRGPAGLRLQPPRAGPGDDRL